MHVEGRSFFVDVFYRMFLYLYINSPRSLGGWEGNDAPHICAEMNANTDPILWIENVERCEYMIHRKANGYFLVLCYGVGIVLGFCIATTMWSCFVDVVQFAKHEMFVRCCGHRRPRHVVLHVNDFMLENKKD